MCECGAQDKRAGRVASHEALDLGTALGGPPSGGGIAQLAQGIEAGQTYPSVGEPKLCVSVPVFRRGSRDFDLGVGIALGTIFTLLFQVDEPLASPRRRGGGTVQTKCLPGQVGFVWYSDDSVYHERLMIWRASPTEWFVLIPDGDFYKGLSRWKSESPLLGGCCHSRDTAP